MDSLTQALLQNGLPGIILAILAKAFWTFLQRRDQEYRTAMERHEKTVASKDREIARLNDLRVKEQKQASELNAQIATSALEMSEALAADIDPVWSQPEP